jgi:hypothetical protein
MMKYGRENKIEGANKIKMDLVLASYSITPWTTLLSTFYMLVHYR